MRFDSCLPVWKIHLFKYIWRNFISDFLIIFISLYCFLCLVFYPVALQLVTYSIQGQNKYSFLEPHHHAVLSSSKAISVQVCLTADTDSGFIHLRVVDWFSAGRLLTCTQLSHVLCWVRIACARSCLPFLIPGSLCCLYSPRSMRLVILGILFLVLSRLFSRAFCIIRSA